MPLNTHEPTALATTAQQSRPLSYDRTASPRLLEALDVGGPCHGLLDRVLADRHRLDLQLRRNQPRECWATVYCGLTSVLDLHEHELHGFRLAVHATHAAAAGFDPDWLAWHSPEALARIWPAVERYLDAVLTTVDRRHTAHEGQVHSRLCAADAPGFAVIDREAAVCFRTDVEKRAIMGSLTTPYLEAVAAAADAPWWHSKPAQLGTGCDLLAMDRVGRLLVVEVKPASSTHGIAWAPAQVGIYADLFQQWVTQDVGHAVDVLQRMLAQRIHLGLSPDLGTPLQNPPRLIPSIVIGGQVRSKVALDRLVQMQQALLAHGAGQRALQVWTLDALGQLRVLLQPR